MMASTHTQVLREEIENGHAFSIGGHVLANLNDKATLLSNNSNVQHPNDHYNQLLSYALTTSFKASGGKYKLEQISLVRKTRHGFWVTIKSGKYLGRITWIPNRSVGYLETPPPLRRRSVRINGSSGYAIITQLSVDDIISNSTLTYVDAPPVANEQPREQVTQQTAENANY